MKRDGKTGLNDSKGLLDVVAGLHEFGYDLFCMVMAARLEVALPITPSLQYSNTPALGERSQLARADLDSKGFTGRGDLHFF